MSQYRQGGYIDKLLIPLIVLGVLFVGAAGFGAWAFMSRQDYKNNSDQKAADAATAERQATQTEDAANYAEEAKNPLKSYVGPADYGAVTFEYPKTWSGYVLQNDGGDTPLNAFFHPDVVPNVDLAANSIALRVAIVNSPYSDELATYSGGVGQGKVTVSPYTLPKVQSVVGSRIEGEIVKDKQGVLVMFPVRNVTLEVWTEATQYLDDFNNIILPNISFSP